MCTAAKFLEERADVSGAIAIAVAVELSIAPAELAKNHLKKLQLLERRNKLSLSFCQWWGFCSAFQGL
jgi:hypothetical protein